MQLSDMCLGNAGWSVKKTLLLKCADSLGADFEGNFLTIDNQSFGLKVWLPNLFGVALGEADIAAILLAFAGEFTFVHTISRN